MNIKATQNYIVSYNNSTFSIHSLSLSHIKSIPVTSCKLFELAQERIFFFDGSSVLSCHIPSEKIETIQEGNVQCLFVKDSFLYIGMDSGLIYVYTFNDYSIKSYKTHKHCLPVKNLKSDNENIYVIDIRDKITVINCNNTVNNKAGKNITYDFLEPKLFFDRFLYAISENKIYINTTEAFGYLFTLKDDPEDVVFSPKGGCIFVKGLHGTRCYDSLGNELGRFFVNDFTVISQEGRCMIVENEGVNVSGELKVTESYLRDRELPEFNFTRMNVKERRIEEEEYDKKKGIVDNKKSEYVEDTVRHRYKNESVVDNTEKKRSTNYSEKRKAMTSVDKTRHDIADENVMNVRHKKVNVFDSSEYDEFNQCDNSNQRDNQCDGGNDNKNTHTHNNTITPHNPSSFNTSQASILLFSHQGFMLSIQSTLSTQVYIKFHDYNLNSIEIKDTLNSHLGSFYLNRFVLSDGNTLNFSDLWTKSINSTLLGINSKYVYSFYSNGDNTLNNGSNNYNINSNILTIFDFNGNIVDEIYNPDAYSFCVGEEYLAIFCTDCIMLINCIDTVAKYIPARNINFGCFDGNILYVRIGTVLFELKGSVLKKVIEIEGRLLSVFDGTAILLESENILPRPVLKYKKLREESVKTVEMAVKKWNPNE